MAKILAKDQAEMDYVVCRATGILKLQNLNLWTFDIYNLLAFLEL